MQEASGNFSQNFVDFVGNVYIIVSILVYFNEYSVRSVSGTHRRSYSGKSPLC